MDAKREEAPSRAISRKSDRTGSDERPPAAAGLSWTALRERIAEANSAYVARHAGEGEGLPAVPRLSLAVVSCMDCRLTGRLEAALGLRPGDAVMVRVAGNTLGGTDDVTRSLAVAVFVQGVRYVLVVGHTDCGMAKIDPLAIGERLRERGVSRFALGALPLREWLGAFRDEARNVRDTVARLRGAAMLPKDVQVAGALLDVQSGELAWLDA